jgi:predicted naringenin-chalcone synthase
MGGMTIPHLNRIGTAVPANEIHGAFITFARTLLDTDRNRMVFDRMAERSGITSRYSVLRPGTPGADQVDADGFLNRGRFPSTGARMQRYEQHATDLALAAIGALAEDPARFTHLVLASCTGFTAPGLDQVLAARLGMSPALERTVVGFMGCYAAVTALRNAYHIVRSDPAARVLVVNLELCTLHLQETPDLETVLAFMLFGDGATAALVTAEPHGLALLDFRATTLPGSAGLITWRIGDQGFDMRLSGQVPARIAGALRGELERTDTGGLLRGQSTQQVDLWAVHAGGRSVLDAVEQGLRLGRDALHYSRAVLNDFGNMSSATIMFILERMLRDDAGQAGFAMAFGPGLGAETFRFRRA